MFLKSLKRFFRTYQRFFCAACNLPLNEIVNSTLMLNLLLHFSALSFMIFSASYRSKKQVLMRTSIPGNHKNHSS